MPIHLTEKDRNLWKRRFYPVIEAENQAFSGMRRKNARRCWNFTKSNMELKANIQKLQNVSSIVEDFIETEVLHLCNPAGGYISWGLTHHLY